MYQPPINATLVSIAMSTTPTVKARGRPAPSVTIMVTVRASSTIQRMKYVRYDVTCSMFGPSEKVEQRENEAPDDVDEVPVEPQHFDALTGRVTTGEPQRQRDEQRHTDEH